MFSFPIALLQQDTSGSGGSGNNNSVGLNYCQLQEDNIFYPTVLSFCPLNFSLYER